MKYIYQKQAFGVSQKIFDGFIVYNVRVESVDFTGCIWMKCKNASFVLKHSFCHQLCKWQVLWCQCKCWGLDKVILFPIPLWERSFHLFDLVYLFYRSSKFWLVFVPFRFFRPTSESFERHESALGTRMTR